VYTVVWGQREGVAGGGGAIMRECYKKTCLIFLILTFIPTFAFPKKAVDQWNMG
jgi:hypothetical protein